MYLAKLSRSSHIKRKTLLFIFSTMHFMMIDAQKVLESNLQEKM